MTDVIPTQADASDIIDYVLVGDEIVVTYESHRAEEEVTVRGMVIDLMNDKAGSRVVFRRPDNQVMWIDSYGKCYSRLSDYPYNGEVVDISLEK